MSEKRVRAGTKLRLIIAVVLLSTLCISSWQLWKISSVYSNERVIHLKLLEYKPVPMPDAEREVVNQSVLDAQRTLNADIVGWLTVPYTKIDYPFVQTQDNDYYLHRDIYTQNAAAGTLFMDAACKPDFSGFNTIIYGHHMKNGSMFGTLKQFADKDFFETNTVGYIYLPLRTITLDIFAYVVIPSTDRIIYGLGERGTREALDEYITTVRQKSVNFREMDFIPGCHVVTLSTCAYDYTDARMVLLAVAK
ncbi:MAG: class B sortase [Oscillospiraceae bacterium]|jgi:sortase B|nr:class B sortase [Oscillospiraceae bacterium]